MANLTTFEDVCGVLGLHPTAASRIERETGAIGPFVRVTEHGKATYVSGAEAVTAYRAGKLTGYQYADARAQDAMFRAIDAKTEAAKVEAQRLAHEQYVERVAIEARNEKARNDALVAATGMRYA